MSNDNSGAGQPNDRRGSVTSAAFSNLFHRSNSTSASGNGNGNAARESVSAAAARDQRRRLSVTTLGLSGASPPSANTPFGFRRGSISSTNYSDSIDENAIDDDEPAKMPTTSPFTRRTSFGAQAMRNMRTGQTSPGSGRPAQQARRTSLAASRQPPPPGASSLSTAAGRRMSTSQASNTLSTRTPSDMLSARSDNGYNWTEQLRFRAESSVTGQRPAFGSVAAPGSPPRAAPHHDRAKSVSDMPAPPRQPEVMKPRQPERPKPDHMQERILKGDFYMD
ncbi:hypothetical protein EKO27_g9127 [Xylaria grammica]|uniref:Uncharacterized protein n=1 Tax=Xylaria grammica TaxID=363999 RepID=A0A439CUY2_9PEZI|nr:hypothetical protein EKO27_g9127 [Xylaria grammica]